MNETTEIAPVPSIVKKCAVAQVLPAAVIELLREAPLNPVARANVLAHVLKPVPPELATFEQIVDWIEANIEPRPMPEPARGLSGVWMEPEAINQIAARPPQVHPVEVAVEYSDFELGTCNYSVSRYGERRIGLDAGELLAYAQDAENIDGLVASLAEHIDDVASEQWPRMEWGDDFDTSDCASTEHDNADRSFSRHSILEQVSTWLQRNQPDLYQRLSQEEEEQENQ